MKSLNLSTWFKLFLLASDAATTMVTVSSYTFDPLNNSWKPSPSRRGNNRSHHSSSSASSYSYAPAEPIPSAGVEFTYNNDDIVSHHYTAFVGGDGELDMNNPAFVPKQTLVEIQYNRRTGEVSLLDEEGVVTPEEYQRLKKAVKFSEEGGDDCNDGTTASEQSLQSQERDEDVAVGTTLYLDPDDLDPTDVIDTESQDLSIVGSANSPPAYTVPQTEEEIYPQQLQDYPDYPEPSVQWHESEEVEPTETFNSYSIPQQTTESNYPVPQYQQQYQYSQQPMQAASAVAEPMTEQYYQEQSVQQQAYEYYPATAVAEPRAPATSEGTVVEDYHENETYRASRGFGFADRREFFHGSD